MLNAAALIIGSNAINAAVTHLSLHTTGAVTSSANESAAGRVAAAGAVDANGKITKGPTNFTGGAANGPVVRVGYWSAATGGTYLGGALLSGDQTFNAAGEYTVTTATETVTSS